MTKAKKRIKLKNGTRATAQPRDEVSLPPAPWGLSTDGPANMVRERELIAVADLNVDLDMRGGIDSDNKF